MDWHEKLTTRMYSERNNPFVGELAGEEDVGGLRLPVPTPPIVVFAIVEVDII